MFHRFFFDPMLNFFAKAVQRGFLARFWKFVYTVKVIIGSKKPIEHLLHTFFLIIDRHYLFFRNHDFKKIPYL